MEVRKGYSLTFHFECKMCGTTSCISTENENENPYLPINQAIINGSVAIGMYFLVVLDINRLSKDSGIILIVINCLLFNIIILMSLIQILTSNVFKKYLRNNI